MSGVALLTFGYVPPLGDVGLGGWLRVGGGGGYGEYRSYKKHRNIFFPSASSSVGLYMISPRIFSLLRVGLISKAHITYRFVRNWQERPFGDPLISSFYIPLPVYIFLSADMKDVFRAGTYTGLIYKSYTHLYDYDIGLLIGVFANVKGLFVSFDGIEGFYWKRRHFSLETGYVWAFGDEMEPYVSLKVMSDAFYDKGWIYNVSANVGITIKGGYFVVERKKPEVIKDEGED